MISVAPTDLANIWGHAKNVRADFIRHSRYDDNYYHNSDSPMFVDQDNVGRNYENMYRLLNSNYNDTPGAKTSNSLSKKNINNGALLFVFLNSDPNTSWRNQWVGLFEILIGKYESEELSFKSIILTNEVIKNSLPVEKSITTNFFAKLASVLGFQYYLPIKYDNPLATSNLSISFRNIEGSL